MPAATPVGPDTLLVRLRTGRLLYVDAADSVIAPHLIQRGVWEEKVEAALHRLVRTGDVVVEAGANVGVHTLTLAQRVGREGMVHAIEPNPELQALLRRTVLANRLTARITLHALALGAQDGKATLLVDPASNGGGNLRARPRAPTHLKRHEVALRSLDSLFAAHGPIQGLRMDIEGSEQPALEGARALLGRSAGAWVMLEWLPRVMRGGAKGPGPAALVATLRSLGFDDPGVIGPEGQIEPIGYEALPELESAELLLRRRSA